MRRVLAVIHDVERTNGVGVAERYRIRTADYDDNKRRDLGDGKGVLCACRPFYIVAVDKGERTYATEIMTSLRRASAHSQIIKAASKRSTPAGMLQCM